MSKVKSRGNISTEKQLVILMRKNKIKGWRRNFEILGKPDFVFPIFKIAVFTDGCFWHGHECRNIHPEQNKTYWDNKISRNIKRDLQINKGLKQLNWIVIRIWECEIKQGDISKITKIYLKKSKQNYINLPRSLK